MVFIESFYGYIETTTDTLLVFEACRRGLLPKITRRLQEKERSLIRSGTVFVFDERESGIKRWTDGLIWSPSRILGNFLIYRELDNREPIETGEPIESRSQNTPYRFKHSGLIKKTMSIVVNGSHLHLISYYHKPDLSHLMTPSGTPQLSHLQLSPDMIHRQSFRVSPLLESPLFFSQDVPRRRPRRSLSPQQHQIGRKIPRVIASTEQHITPIDYLMCTRPSMEPKSTPDFASTAKDGLMYLPPPDRTQLTTTMYSFSF